jgi:hypothetical protein
MKSRWGELTSEFAELLPSARKWDGGKGFAPQDWARAEGNIQLAIAYSTIFWPTFIEYKDMVFLAPIQEANVDDWIREFDGQTVHVEEMVNHIHLFRLFQGPSITDKQLIYIGNTLRQIWSTKLATEFPKRSFKVEFDDQRGQNLDGYEITFFQFT